MKIKSHLKKYFLNTVSSMLVLAIAGCSSSHEEKPELIMARRISPYYTVQDGDTVQSIADRYEMPVEEFIRVNSLSVPYTVYSGQKVVVYQKGMAHTNHTPLVKTFQSDGVSVSEIKDDNQKDDINANSQKGGEAKSGDSTNEEGSTSEKEPLEEKEEVSSSDEMKWPVKGKVIVKFGGKKNGQTSKGISIAAPEGTPVYAAESGKVFKSNVDLDGFGKTVIIQHDDGKMSVYSHLKVCLVKPGQVVDGKTVIGRVGKTGGLKKPELHFQVRIASKPVNPLTLLN
ncbi:MAG: M23 family metallopeptidase [Proteobacteria bacterium]|nr:M23 family metallopeptidase [Pseudomonadota bacterium]